MALQSQAQLLDELMGKHRNAGPGAQVSATKFDDDDVCKYALVSFCPHDLFINTRADLGPCNKIHDEELRKQYEKSSRFGKLGFEDVFEDFVRGLLSDVEKRIRRGNERLKLTQTDQASQKNTVQAKQERVISLKEQINSMIKQAERLGEEGKIEEAQETLEASEKLKSECKHLEIQLENNQHTEQKQMEVCDVCGSFLIVNDAASRLEEHISGKQHVGYAKLRDALEQLRKKRLEMNDRRDRDRNRDRNRDYDRDRLSKSERERSRNRSRSKDRHRSDRYRDSKRRSHSRSPSRTSNGHSSKSHKHHRSRSRDRDDYKSKSKHSSRHRSRSRSSSRSRKSRHHSQDRHKRPRREDEPTPADEKSKAANSNGNDSHGPKNGEKSPPKIVKEASSEKEEGEEDD